MKEYVSPAVEFIELEENDVICESLCTYECPDQYGTGCSGFQYTTSSKSSASKNSSKKMDDVVKVGFDLTFDK